MMKAMTSAEPLLNVAHWVPRSRVNGPGERFVLWTQGCGLACPGCWNPDTWSFAPRHLVAPTTVMEWIRAAPGIEGVTFSGGEPFAQAAPLLPLARSIQEAGLSLMIFTGHELSELRGEAHRQLLGLTDIVVTGRYVESQRNLSLRWRGSENQQVHFLTPRYPPSLLEEPAAAVEIVIESDGSLRLTGFPEDRLRSILGT
jgi:anaerobic ribonucleoside-triphosphate reductase activating protein